jgi:hypothetical protein
MSGRIHSCRRDPSARNLHGQKPVNRDTILQCLTRLNEKATQRSAAEELGTIVQVRLHQHGPLQNLVVAYQLHDAQALEADSLSFFISSICSTGPWEPRPSVRKARTALALHTLEDFLTSHRWMLCLAGLHPCSGPASLRCLPSKGLGSAAAPRTSAPAHQEAHAGKTRLFCKS